MHLGSVSPATINKEQPLQVDDNTSSIYEGVDEPQKLANMQLEINPWTSMNLEQLRF